MRQDVAKGGNVTPGDCWILAFQGGQIGIPETLANDFEVAKNGILGFRAGKEAGGAVWGVFDDSGRAVTGMGEKDIGVFPAHNGTASERMRLAR